jgi:hypothetical protein
LLQFLRLRKSITFLCLLWLGVAARADVIRLKNGSRIVADSVHESNGRVEYTVGENTFAIPKSLVDRIDAGPPANVPASAAAVAPEDLPRVSERFETSSDVIERVIHDGRVDSATLQAIEKEGNPQRAAIANLAAGNFEQRRDHLPVAANYLQAALKFSPEEPVLLESYASLLLQLGKPAEALVYAQREIGRAHV